MNGNQNGGAGDQNGQPQKSKDLLTTYCGVVDPSSFEVKKNRKGEDYTVATIALSGKTERKTLYLHTEKVIAALREAMEEAKDDLVFVTGGSLASGKSLAVNRVGAKLMAGTIEKVHKSGESEVGPWASIRFAQKEGKPFNVLLDGDIAKKAVEAGEGGGFEFWAAWQPEKNDETGEWHSRCVNAGRLRRGPPKPPAPEQQAEASTGSPSPAM